MIFHRSIPEYSYRDYTRYRKLLRSDFQFRCAYCLTLETHIGGEANFTIDHYRPRRGRFARPDLEAVYSNLYWICRECNENKGDDWTTPEQEAAGIRWLTRARNGATMICTGKLAPTAQFAG
jgi:5-methylcytosine-specific restriction endonuclease McrA